MAAQLWHWPGTDMALLFGPCSNFRWCQMGAIHEKSVSVTCHIKSMSHSLPVRFLKMLASQEKAVIEKKIV